MKKIIGIVLFAFFIAGLFFIGCGKKATVSTTTTTTTTTIPPVAGVYYVATTGSDSNSGTSLTSPWKTIQHAVNTVQAGSTVYIRGGVYNEHIDTVRNGAPNAHIVLSSYQTEVATIEGPVLTYGNGIIVDNSYIKLIGLHIRNWSDNGIEVIGAGSIEVSNCVIYDVDFGIGFAEGAHDFVVNSSEAYNFSASGYGFDVSPRGIDCYNGTFNDCVAHTTRSGAGGGGDGFAASHEGNQYNFVFNRCRAYDINGDGFVFGGNNVKAIDCSASNCNQTGGFKLWPGTFTLVNCLSYDSDINFELDKDTDHPTTTITAEVWNCTFMNANTYNIVVESNAGSLHMYNSIVAGSQNLGLVFQNETDFHLYSGDHNVFHHNTNPNMTFQIGGGGTLEGEYNLNGWKPLGQDTNSLVASPEALFVNATSPYDLRLKAGSPAIDKGTSVGAPAEASKDYIGTLRPQGSAYDIGAYERQ